MKIFNLKNFNIVVDAEALLVPEFKELWDRDKSKNKEKAYNELSYVYMVSDNNSPYSNMPKERREKDVKRDILKNEKYKLDTDILKAVDKYKLLSETPTQRLFNSVQNKIDDIADYLDKTHADEKTMSAILQAIEKVSKLVANYDTIKNAVENEKSKGETRRGQKTTRLFEDR
jgi:hypothetical protein